MADQAAGCVLFADVSGSTKLYEAVGDSAAHAAIDGCVKMFSDVTALHAGRVVKTIGDEVMSIFPGATEGLRAAVEMQSNLAEMAPVGGTPISRSPDDDQSSAPSGEHHVTATR